MGKRKTGIRHPAYNLRTNKAVDRLLLAEILRLLEYDNDDCAYYSLAGPFLEDLRVMDQYLPKMQLTSIESNEQTYRRQEFHKFNSRLKIVNKNFNDFLIQDYKPGKVDVFWLDYTGLNYRNLGEFQVVLKAVPPGSVIRITLCAEPKLDLEYLQDLISPEELDRLRTEVENNFDKEFRSVLPHPPPGAFAKFTDFAKMVQDMVKRAASQALDTAGSETDFLPIQTTRYNDNTQMLSVTGIVYLRAQKDKTRERLKSVRFPNFDWKNEPEEINIPNLSLKERFHLESLLPVLDGQDAGTELFDKLGYYIDVSEDSSKRQLSHYAEYCREYPNFLRITV